MSDETATNENIEPAEETGAATPLEELSAKLDELGASVDNATQDASAQSAEEAPEIEALKATISQQQATIDKVIEQMGKMVLLYGARISENATDIKDSLASPDDDIPEITLEDIKLS